MKTGRSVGVNVFERQDRMERYGVSRGCGPGEPLPLLHRSEQ